MPARKKEGLRAAAIAAVLTAAIAGGAPPAPAAPTEQAAGGAVEFEGIAFLQEFPCPAGDCSGTFEGAATVTFSGRANDDPWAALAVAVPISARFTYADTCFGVGLARGRGHIDAGGKATGTYGPQAPAESPFDGPSGSVVGMKVPFRFSWTRVGAAAIVEASGSGTLTLQSGGDVEVFDSRPATGVATFALTSVPDCLGSPGPIEAHVAGTIAFPPAAAT